MKNLIVFPTTEKNYNNLPISFRARYSNVVSIIDCFEIQIEKPANVVDQSMTWSNYKNCNTFKWLISCIPDGSVSFISKGYGGRATGITIVKDCGYLECIFHNRDVMDDKGLKELSQLLLRKNCTLVRPTSVLLLCRVRKKK